jgi:hypothetical protein
MIRFLLYALLAWFLFNLIFRFIIPVYRTTRQVKKKFREMQDHIQQQQADQEAFNQQQASKQSSTAPRSEDYIDFEEIK